MKKQKITHNQTALVSWYDSPKRRKWFLALHLFFAVFYTICVGLVLKIGVIAIVYRLNGFPLWDLGPYVIWVSVMALIEWVLAIHLLHEQRERRRIEKKWWL